MLFRSPHGIWRKQNRHWLPIEGRWNTGVRALQPTEDNRLWIGTLSGLYLLDLKGNQKMATLIHHPNALQSSNIYAFKSENGKMWIGSTGGIDLYENGKRVRSHTVQNGLHNRHARAIALDKSGRLWVATKLGVSRYDGTR